MKLVYDGDDDGDDMSTWDIGEGVYSLYRMLMMVAGYYQALAV